MNDVRSCLKKNQISIKDPQNKCPFFHISPKIFFVYIQGIKNIYRMCEKKVFLGTTVVIMGRFFSFSSIDSYS